MKHTAIITDQRDAEIRRELARIRSGMFNLSEADQVEAGERIAALKAEAMPLWDAQARQHEAKRLEAMGF